MLDLIDLAKTLITHSVVLLARPLAFLSIFPLFAEQLPSGILRTGACMAIFLPLTLASGLVPEVLPKTQWLLLALLLREGAIGVFLGLYAGLAYWALQTAGSFLDNLRGAAMAEAIAPGLNEPSSYGAVFFQQMALLVFLMGDGVHLLVSMLLKSVMAFPIELTLFAIDSSFFVAFIVDSAALFSLCFVAFLVPTIGCVIIDLCLSYYSRYNAQLNVIFVASPVKTVFVFGAILVGLAFYMDYFAQLLSAIPLAFDRVLAGHS